MIAQLMDSSSVIMHEKIQPHMRFRNADKLLFPDFSSILNSLRRKGTLENFFLFIKLCLVVKKKRENQILIFT